MPATPQMTWLPNPADGTSICLGFDGSVNNDWTTISGETMEGYSFTPRWGPDKFGSYWNPDENGGSIPHGQVSAALDEIFTRFNVVRMYCDPHDWETDIEDWALKYGDETILPWPTYNITKMHAELVRFENDLVQKRITHDGDPMASVHINNAKKVGKPGQKFILGKPSELQKIDIAMSRVLAHTAARDSLSTGWEPPKDRKKMRVYRTKN